MAKPCAHCAEMNELLVPTEAKSLIRRGETGRYLLCSRCKRATRESGALPPIPLLLEQPCRYSSEGWRRRLPTLGEIEREIGR